MPPVDESHQIVLSALEALRAQNQGQQRPRAPQRQRAALKPGWLESPDQPRMRPPQGADQAVATEN